LDGTKFRQDPKTKTTFDPALVAMNDFGVALFQLILSLIPPVLQTIGNFVGFEANRENAIKLLQSTYESGCPRAVEAGLALVGVKQILFKEEDEAKALFAHLQASFPNAILLTTSAAHLSRFQGDIEAALSNFQTGLAYHEKNSSSPPVLASLNRDIATCHWQKNDWNNAAIYYEKFLNVPVELSKKNYRPTASFNLGFCYWMVDGANNTEKIISTFKRAKEWVRDEESWDVIALRKMEDFIKRKTFDPWDQVYESANALVEGKQWKFAQEVVEKLVPLQEAQQDRKDFFAFYNYVKGRCALGQKDYEGAESHFKKTLTEDGKLKFQAWLVPYTLFYLGDLAMDRKDWQTALNYFDQTKKYKDFDWDKMLSIMVYVRKQSLIPHIPNIQF